jgi:hypothetical protein
MCDVKKLKLKMPACSNQQIKLTVEQNGEKIDLCDSCWQKVCKKDNFYTKVDAL